MRTMRRCCFCFRGARCSLFGLTWLAMLDATPVVLGGGFASNMTCHLFWTCDDISVWTTVRDLAQLCSIDMPCVRPCRLPMITRLCRPDLATNQVMFGVRVYLGSHCDNNDVPRRRHIWRGYKT